MSASVDEPIAVVGIGCRFPGGVASGAGLWSLAAEGRSTVGPVPAGRWDAAGLGAIHAPDDAMRAGRGCFLDGDVWAWDPPALSVAPAEQRWVDPQFRVLMEVAWEAVEHAGIPIDRIRGTRAGVYMGTYAPDNLFREARPVEDAPNSPYLFGNFTAGAAGRVAFSLDLRGPVMVISTHCSSGLVAVDTACGALTLGECDVALAGGVLLMLSPLTHYYEAPLLLSRRGACHAFDARADGYVRGEGAGVLVLERLADAQRAGHRVLAVIEGSAVNNDGQATRLTAPSTVMQQQLFRAAVERAGIDPGEVGLVEAHGPGTAVGDPIEFTSIDAVYGRGRGRCALGSIKTVIGHSEPVSGIAGTIKAIECLRRGLIPPNLNFTDWNPSIHRDAESRLFVPTEVAPWPVPEAVRRAAVCSYGVTGTNAHLILRQAPAPARSRAPRSPARAEVAGPVWLLPLSGSSAESLRLAAGRLADWAEGEGAEIELADAAHTLALHRWHADHRLCVVARDQRELATRARGFAAGAAGEGVVSGVIGLPRRHAGPVFVFTGQGSQRPGMCQGLLSADPVFAATIARVEPLIAAESGISVREMITRPDRMVGLDRIQPTLFAVQVALAAVWRSWGVEPAAVIGQSLGEVAAAVVAGGLDVADGVRVICRRSRLLATIRGGAMASVLLDADAVAAAIEAAGADGVTLGVLTAPHTTVISGDAVQVGELIAAWQRDGVVAKPIDVDVASHSPQVDPILAQLAQVLAEIPPADPAIPFYSTVSAQPLAPGRLDGDYWVRNQRDTVRFRAAVGAALAQGHRVFIECTPHPLAVRPILETAEADGIADAVAVGTLRQGVDDRDAMATHLGALHCAGFDGVDWAARYRYGRLADLPPTAWHRVRHGGDEPPYRLVAPGLVGASEHPLLGGHVSDPDSPDRHWWQTPIGPARLPWLADHRVADVPVLAGAAVVDMMLAAAATVCGTDCVRAAAIEILAPLVLDPEPTVTTRVFREGRIARIEILSGAGAAVTVHARGEISPAPTETVEATIPLDAGPDWRETRPADLYAHFRDHHNVCHGPAFTGVDTIRVHPERDEAVAALHIPDTARVSAWTMRLHPVLTDELVHTVVAVWLAHHVTSPGPVVVAGFDEVRVTGITTHARHARVRVHQADDRQCVASGVLTAADGAVVAEVRGLRLTNITPATERFAARLAHLHWTPAPAPATRARPTTGTWAILAADPTPWAELMPAFERRGIDCTLIPVTGSTPLPPEPCTGVVLAVDSTSRTEDPAAAARTAVGRAVTLIQHLADRSTPARLWFADRGEPGDSITVASLTGLLRVAAYEHPGLKISRLAATPDIPAGQMVEELLDPDLPIIEISLSAGERRVARVRAGGDREVVLATTPPPVIGHGAGYLVTGGLGGLGLLTVEWLAAGGAGRIVLLGRSAPDSDTRARLDALRTPDCDITFVRGDVADPAVACAAVTAARTGGTELRGVIHAAGVVEDATLRMVTPDLLDRVWRGKAAGAWTLHLATRECPLDFFAVYSSLASLAGSPGQGAYAAANAFLDGLVAQRLREGLPATGIHWGPWAEVGRGRHLAERGFLTITPADGIDALHRILAAGYHRVAYSPLDLNRWTEPYPGARTCVLLADTITDIPVADDDATLRNTLHTKGNRAARHDLVENFIIDTVRDLLGGTTRHIGPHTSMVILGLDSLGAVQLQQRLQRALAIDIKPGVIWVKPTPADLADWILEQLDPTEPQPPRRPAPDGGQPGSAVSHAGR
ncbi:SDR family NAD(P)-dependent oxidoreductase [Nocardia brasiliensis]|uniref:SDR family NAD(P)-dependent oxidoreductase n=1 Tax=Nocardia brasiliensis TaxID=37326 RepID=UPI003400B5E4